MKSNVLTLVFAIVIAMVCCINVFNVQKSEPLSDIALANVEALASVEDGYITEKYCTIHIKCFDINGSSTGKYTADSYQGKSCTYSTPHEHSCEYCSSR